LSFPKTDLQTYKKLFVTGLKQQYSNSIQMKSIQKIVQNQSQVWYTIISEIAAIPSKTEVLHMTNYNTLGYNLKRGVFNFCNKLSKDSHRTI